ncbi:MAG: hypothetical protein Q8934_08195 [Bacillota bacterium]|nr:hypothetical protein [Bacillota bacterium]
MKKELENAIDLGKSENHKESNQLLLKLVQDFPDDASINYQCAYDI